MAEKPSVQSQAATHANAQTETQVPSQKAAQSQAAPKAAPKGKAAPKAKAAPKGKDAKAPTVAGQGVSAAGVAHGSMFCPQCQEYRQAVRQTPNHLLHLLLTLLCGLWAPVWVFVTLKARTLRCPQCGHAMRSAQALPAQRALGVEPRPAEGGLHAFLGVLFFAVPSWLVSMVVHVVVLLVLALLTLPEGPADEARELLAAPDEDEQFEEILEPEIEPPEEIRLEVSDLPATATAAAEAVDVSPFDDLTAAPISVELSDFGLQHAPRADLLNQVGTFMGNDLAGRGGNKDQLAKRGGGTTQSEQAVALALEWLANHQLPDGSWSFDHTLAPYCRGQCRNRGNIPKARNGATAMALLPFLGAGQTHLEGKYKDQVRAGLYFLVKNMQVGLQGGSLYENGGRMYSHGLGSIALCEAFAMTHDKHLYEPAQYALNFIAFAQDQVGGGWRYEPHQRGDTSVVGWQIMALKSGHMAYLHVPPGTAKKANRYLDSVQANNGAHYGYTDPAAGRQACTAIGLLCRMYLGWKKDEPALQRGVAWISQQGPSKDDMYFNYYATQVMHHWEGDPWKKWNNVMRDQLVQSQAQKGHERGSWFMEKGHQTDKGGRLYCTSMATMILEVYYRHLPIYRKQSTEEDFPID